MTDHISNDLLQQFADGALAETDAQRLAVAQHVAGCAGCAARLQELHALYATLESLPEVELSRDLAPRVVAALQVQPPRPVLSPQAGRALRLGMVAQAVAAIVLLALAWRFVAPLAPEISLADVAAQLWLPNGAFEFISIAELRALLSSARAALTQFTPAGLGDFSSIPIALWSLGIVVAGLVWLVGNGLLLHTPRAARTPKRAARRV